MQPKGRRTVRQEVLHLPVDAVVAVPGVQLVDQRATGGVGRNHGEVGGRNHGPHRDVIIHIGHGQLHPDQVPVLT